MGKLDQMSKQNSSTNTQEAEATVPMAVLSVTDLKDIATTYDYFPQFTDPRTYLVSKEPCNRRTKTSQNECIYLEEEGNDAILTRVSVKHLLGQMYKNNESLFDSILEEDGVQLLTKDRFRVVKSEDGAIYFDPLVQIR
tara:strand:- start:230 stop:646 length:417 start_codon:yes stop_codon:yes gene_type:complete